MSVTKQLLPDRPAPISQIGPVAWLRENLFSGPVNTLVTILALYFLYLVIPPVFDWLFLSANWQGETRDACTNSGACWVFIIQRFEQFMYGFYPENLHWRPNLAGILLVLLVVPLFFKRVPHKGWIAAFILLVYPVIAYFLLHGGAAGLEEVNTGKWGGLMLTLILSIFGIVAALPIGILLALGRRSSMPIVRAVSTVYIELWRGAPLITILFMSSVMLPLFLPEGFDIDKLARAMVGIALFQSAYVAEAVRGGLQAIPKGQYEAAAAMGLTYWKSMRLVILPQALKLSIPGMVNTFIELFKDTSLVLIIGLFDLLAIIQQANADSNWLGFDTEGYIFAALVYWIFCFGMSRYSLALEKKLDTGHRH